MTDLIHLERERAQLQAHLAIKDQQIASQSKTIDTLLELDGHTLVLARELQSMAGRLLAPDGQRRPNAPVTSAGFLKCTMTACLDFYDYFNAVLEPETSRRMFVRPARRFTIIVR